MDRFLQYFGLFGRFPVRDDLPVPVGGDPLRHVDGGAPSALAADHGREHRQTLGSCANWFLGRLIAYFEGRRWFRITKQQPIKAEGWYRRYRRWSLLLSLIPVIGDPLTIVAGMLREPFPVFLAVVGLAKTLRYVAVAAVTLGWMGGEPPREDPEISARPSCDADRVARTVFAGSES